MGVTAERLGRWERREEFPTAAHTRILARVLAFDAGSFDGASPAVAPVAASTNGNSKPADPWGHLRSGKSNGNGRGDRFGLNRDALLKGQARSRRSGSNGSNGNSTRLVRRVVEDVALPSGSSLPDAPAFAPLPPVPTAPPPGNGNGDL